VFGDFVGKLLSYILARQDLNYNTWRRFKVFSWPSCLLGPNVHRTL